MIVDNKPPASTSQLQAAAGATLPSVTHVGLSVLCLYLLKTATRHCKRRSDSCLRNRRFGSRERAEF